MVVYRFFVVFLVILFSLLLSPSQTVDISKFKNCDDLSFCRRQRNFNPSSLDYHIPSQSLELKGSKLVGTIKESKSNTQYSLEFTRFNDSIIRLRINEKKPLYPRHVVSDVIMEENLIEVPFKKFDSAKNSLIIDEDRRIEIDPKTLKFDVFYKDEKALSINQRGLFYFEYLRERSGAIDHDHKDTDTHQVDNLNTSEVIDMKDAFEESWKNYKDSKKRGPESIGMDFRFYSKGIYGIPEHAIDLDLPPTKGEGIKKDPYRLYNLDVFEYDLDSTMALYGAVPLLHGHDERKTVGLLWLNSAETWVDIEKPDNKEFVDAHWFSESGIVDVYIMIHKEPKPVMRDYMKLTGPQALPPLFSVGYHQCKWNYNDEEDVAKVHEGFETHNIPFDVLWLDIEHTDSKKYFTWDSKKFPTPKDMQANLAKYDRKMVTIIDPHIKRDNNYEVNKEAQKRGFYVKNKKGEDYEGWCWPGSSSYLDFLNPEVRNWWASLYKYDKYEGSTPTLYTWNDMNEPSVFNGPEITMDKDCLHHGDVEHRHIHNMYGMYMHMSTYKGQLERNEGHNIRPFVLSRSFFAGTQRYGAIWTGDNEASWDHLRASVPMLLSLGMGGITFNGADVGGFFRDPDGELMARWYQLGAWYPFFRAHGHIDAKRKEPWVFGEPYLSVIREAIRSRYVHLPYIYTQFYQANQKLYPILRPLFFEFNEDPNTFSMDDAFLVGSSILAKTVGEQGQKSVKIYFPKDTLWYDWKSFKQYEGKAKHEEIPTPLDYFPVFYRGGSIIPIKETVRRTSGLMKNDPYTLIVALDQNEKAQGELYLDDFETFNFKKGDFIHREFTFTKDESMYIIQSTPVGDENEKYADSVKNTLNKVIVVGAKNKPVKVTLVQDNVENTLDFEYDEASHRINIRKPDALISKSWRINIKF